jgi:hypothetical protein
MTSRDLPSAIMTDRIADYFDGNLIVFAQLVVNALLSPVVEELVFRGLLPRMPTENTSVTETTRGYAPAHSSRVSARPYLPGTRGRPSRRTCPP